MLYIIEHLVARTIIPSVRLCPSSTSISRGISLYSCYVRQHCFTAAVLGLLNCQAFYRTEARSACQLQRITKIAIQRHWFDQVWSLTNPERHRSEMRTHQRANLACPPWYVPGNVQRFSECGPSRKRIEGASCKASALIDNHHTKTLTSRIRRNRRMQAKGRKVFVISLKTEVYQQEA